MKELEDLVADLENERRINLEKIRELEDTLNANYEDIDAEAEKHQETVYKLATENTELNSKLVAYLEEMEDMDMKMENLENENKILKTTLEDLQNGRVFGSHMDHVHELESEKQDLLNKLEKEKEHREFIEIELFKTEEDLEKYLAREGMCDYNNNDHNDIENKLLPTISEMDIAGLDYNGKSTALEDQMDTIQKLETEKASISSKAALMQAELKILLEENSMLAKSNDELRKSKTRDEGSELKIADLEEKLKEMEEERRQSDQDVFHRLVSLAEKEYKSTHILQEQSYENERLLSELKTAQGNLAFSNSKIAEMRNEIEKKDKEYQERLNAMKEEMKTEFHGLKVSLEEETRRKYEEKKLKDQNNFIHQMQTTMKAMKEEYESKLAELNSTLTDLELHIKSMRGSCGCKSISTTSSTTNTTPSAMTKDKYHSMGDISHLRHSPLANGDISHLRDSPLTNGDNVKGQNSIVNGEVQNSESKLTCSDVVFRNRYKHESVSPIYCDHAYGLSDREMRRISYKVAEGSWKRLSFDLPISGESLSQVMNSSGNEQEKVYQLLNCWRTEESNVPRLDLLTQLTEYIDPNRKDVIKLLREMAGIPPKDRKSIKNKFKRLKHTVKR